MGAFTNNMNPKTKFNKLIKQCIAEVLVEGPIAPRADKISNGERTKMGKEFAKLGLDGNGRFEKKEYGLQAVTNVLQSLGFQLDMVSSDKIMGDKGSCPLPYRRINDPGQDQFSENPEIINSRIVFSWELLEAAKFEILVYAS